MFSFPYLSFFTFFIALFIFNDSTNKLIRRLYKKYKNNKKWGILAAMIQKLQDNKATFKSASHARVYRKQEKT